jgi:hypothetical protein
MKPLAPLSLSAACTLALIAILVVTSSVWWRERARIVRDTERLRRQYDLTETERGLVLIPRK